MMETKDTDRIEDNKIERIDNLRKNTLEKCRDRGLAALETGISWPVPKIVGGKIQLKFFFYWSQLEPEGKGQIDHEPFRTVTIDYETGEILEIESLLTEASAKEIGRFPTPTMAGYTRDERRSLWKEFDDLYPSVIEEFSLGKQTNPSVIKKFIQLSDITLNDFFLPYYKNLNPDFFLWLDQNRTDEVSERQ